MIVKSPEIRQILAEWGIRFGQEGAAMTFTKSPLHPAKIIYITPDGSREVELPADWTSLVHYLERGWKIHPTITPPFCSDKAKLARLEARVTGERERLKAEEAAMLSGKFRCPICTERLPSQAALEAHTGAVHTRPVEATPSKKRGRV